ncbi:MAG: UDP-N-acetylglucosamine--N-acetylmuramyl-(pentapeptide) pyrophosphoryl-undecaprenol N-acetylglucosamine transferase [Armatimonadetes bacterium]|nr:UDP-N-acetylglucosamine--N-acetylmuramyl-(pentapeptide) pyrophosphoryl-undecaprenol N-acetylglucosamine transferase [Armatimonadota bacterium]
MTRSVSLGAVRALGVNLWGAACACRLLLTWRPDVVLGTGGYASAAVMFAAAALGRLRRIPIVMHEANAVPGRVNRLLGRYCRRVAVTFEDTLRWFPPAIGVCVGLPIRPEVGWADPAVARREFQLQENRLTLAVVGGSGGAQSLNRAVLAALPLLEATAPTRFQIVHQTGRSHFDAVREAAPTLDWYHPTAYIEWMPSLLAAADLICCRTGSSTLAEVAAAGLPALLVPYPHAVADHQTQNARILADAGAGILIPDAEFTGERLVVALEQLEQDRARLESMAAASRSLARPQAAEEVAHLLREVARG